MTLVAKCKPRRAGRRSLIVGAVLSAIAITGSGDLASAAPKPTPLTPDKAILACHAHASADITSTGNKATASRRYHAAKTTEGFFKVIGHFLLEDADANSAQFDVECLVSPDGSVVDYSVASKPVSSEQIGLSVALSRLASDPSAEIPAKLSEVNFQDAFYIVDRLDQADLEALSRLIGFGAVDLPVNIREAIEARLPASKVRRFEGR